MQAGLNTVNKAKKIVGDALQENGFSYTKLKAETISFSGLGYGEGIFVNPINFMWPNNCPTEEVPLRIAKVRDAIFARSGPESKAILDL